MFSNVTLDKEVVMKIVFYFCLISGGFLKEIDCGVDIHFTCSEIKLVNFLESSIDILWRHFKY